MRAVPQDRPRGILLPVGLVARKQNAGNDPHLIDGLQAQIEGIQEVVPASGKAQKFLLEVWHVVGQAQRAVLEEDAEAADAAMFVALGRDTLDWKPGGLGVHTQDLKEGCLVGVALDCHEGRLPDAADALRKIESRF